MNKTNIIIYPYKGNIGLLKEKVQKWRKQFSNITIQLKSNTREPLSENSRFLALYTTRENNKKNIETTADDKVFTYKDSSYMAAYKKFLACELGRDIPDEDFICINDKNTIHLEKKIAEIANAEQS